jgi:ABC-type uncharacterized transport system substrate-binding protein
MKRQVLSVLLAALLAAVLCPAALAFKVAFLLSHQTDEYREISRECESALRELVPEIEIRIFNLNRSISEARLIREVIRFFPDVNFAVGTPAALFCKSLDSPPFVYTMVPDIRKLDFVNRKGMPSVNGTGIRYRAAYADLFAQLKKSFPDTRTIGVLRGKGNAHEIGKARRTIRRAGFDLEIENVSPKEMVSRKFRELIDRGIDVFWFVPDFTFLRTGDLNYLLKSCEIRNLPFLTNDPLFYRNVSTLGIVPNFKGLGRQAARLILRLEEGDPVDTIPVEYPKYVQVQKNEEEKSSSIWLW